LYNIQTIIYSFSKAHLEYANQVWCPYLKKDIEAIENVQRRAGKQIPGLSSLSYEGRLRKLKLPTLAYRRSCGDIIYLYKILTGKYDEDVSNLLRTRDESTTRGHQYKLYKSHSRLDIRKYSFTQRTSIRLLSNIRKQTTVEIWSNLPSKVVTALTIMSFESRLDKFWENQPRKYNYSHEIVINTTGHDLNITSLDEELTEEASSGDLQSEEDL
jgi:hypothetical protein